MASIRARTRLERRGAGARRSRRGRARRRNNRRSGARRCRRRDRSRAGAGDDLDVALLDQQGGGQEGADRGAVGGDLGAGAPAAIGVMIEAVAGRGGSCRCRRRRRRPRRGPKAGRRRRRRRRAGRWRRGARSGAWLCPELWWSNRTALKARRRRCLARSTEAHFPSTGDAANRSCKEQGESDERRPARRAAIVRRGRGRDRGADRLARPRAAPDRLGVRDLRHLLDRLDPLGLPRARRRRGSAPRT